VTKLVETNVVVERMKKDLMNLQPVLQKALPLPLPLTLPLPLPLPLPLSPKP
jgi:hypothetical protein